MITVDQVSLVIPVYNQLMHTMQCLESIQRLPDQAGEVIVIDNGSSDGTPEYLKGRDLRVITNSVNLGCAKAWNQGVRASRGDVIGILNNDIVVTQGWLSALMTFMDQTGCGIVSPAMREGPLDYELDRYAAEFTTACHTATRRGVRGPCMFIRREVFDRVGLFDEGFVYGGCEDTDFLWRIREAGFTAIVTGAAFIHHFGMVTQRAIKQREIKTYPTQNLEYFQNKWGRTVRGNWFQRRWTDFQEALIERYERIRYGHALVERGIAVRVVITGGAGFLGSHLCQRLIGLKHDVICIDNLITGWMDNIAHLIGHERFTFVKYNVCDYLHVTGPLDAVMHFASPASPWDYLEFPIATLKVGALGTHKALGLAKAKNARFLLASTSEVYGDPLVSPQPEEYWGNVNPISPRGVYDEAKRFAEAMTMAYHRYHGLDTRIVRIFNTYGPAMRPKDGRVVSNFIVQALSGQPLTVYGDGSQTRSFCYVDDLVEGITRLLLVPSDKTHEERTDRTFIYQRSAASVHDPTNIGNPQELSVLEIAQKVQALVGTGIPIEFKPLPADDPKVRRPDITRARKLLEWEPKVGLDEGLRRTIEYFRKRVG